MSEDCHPKVLPMLLSAALVAASPALAGPPSTPSRAVDVSQAAAVPPRSDDLTETAANQPRWLTLPQSPVVLNPYEVLSAESALAQSNPPQLPLNAGYYIDHPPVRSDGFHERRVARTGSCSTSAPRCAPVPLRSFFYDSSHR